MSRTATYHTTVRWTGEHWGQVEMGNGPEMKFSAPPDANGHAGVLTPEDAFVAAANSCIMMMFLWATERFRLNLLSFECRAEGTKLVELDRTEIFTRLHFRPVIRIARGNESKEAVQTRTLRALEAAQKYSLIGFRLALRQTDRLLRLSTLSDQLQLHAAFSAVMDVAVLLRPYLGQKVLLAFILAEDQLCNL